MKINKKMATTVAFAVGVSIFATSALADVMAGSGYNNAKNAVKATAAAMTAKSGSYTTQIEGVIKIDGDVFTSQNTTIKTDLATGKVEERGVSYNKQDGTFDSYMYKDKEKYIYKNSDEDTYQLTKLSKDAEKEPLSKNPFDEDIVKDAEKVVDAFIGGLKDVVQVEESENSKMYFVNMTDAQIPAFVNAGAGFMLKYGLMENRSHKDEMPELSSDIALKEVSGKMIENANGLIESGIGKAVLTGNDKNGTTHEVILEVNFALTDIDATDVVEPNLEGQNVEMHENNRMNGLSAAYVGTYKNNITKKQDGQFVKVGERVVEITSADGNTVVGKISEVGTDKAFAIDFTAQMDTTNNGFGYTFTYTDATGEQKNGIIDASGGENLRVALGVIFQDHGYQCDSDGWNGELIRQF